MYSLSSLKIALRDPRQVCIEVNKVAKSGIGWREQDFCNQGGMDIPGADWDNLILLDACRYDAFREAGSHLQGRLRARASKASATSQFLRANFSDAEFLDTVYVTANPQLYRIEERIYDTEPLNTRFHDVVNVWQDGWDDEHNTVRPEKVTEAVLTAAEDYPNKRILVHYMQPHAPYIGDVGSENLPTDYLNFWGSYEDGEFDIDIETARRAYKENLNMVIPHVESLLSKLSGKTVVTADHGELLGERDRPIPIRRYGHPSYTLHPKLITVPWLEHTNGDRKSFVAEDTGVEHETEIQMEDEVVKDRLRNLGYTE